MRKFEILTAAGVVLAMSGCGVTEVMDATKSMPGRMDQMIGKMDDTLEAISDTNTKIEKTNNAVHKQKLLMALTELLKADNTKYLAPPTGMMPAGESFAEEATPTELIKLTYVWLKEVEKAQAMGTQKPEEVDADKLVKLVALQIIAGFTSQEKVEAIVDQQILKGGRYEKAAYAFLMARVLFLRDTLIPSVLDDQITNLGSLEEAVQRSTALDYVARLPFSDKIQLVTKGMSDPELNVNEKLDPKVASDTWQKVSRAAETELEAQYLAPEYAEAARVSQAREKVTSAVSYWKEAVANKK